MQSEKLLKMKPRSKRLAGLEKELTNSEAEKHLVETPAKHRYSCNVESAARWPPEQDAPSATKRADLAV